MDKEAGATGEQVEEPMAARNGMRLYPVVRQVHLYIGLFCIPWMLIYATSGLFINHQERFRSSINAAQDFEVIAEYDFTPPDDFPRFREERAAYLLKHVGLEGPHFVPAGRVEEGLTVNRPSAGGAYRIQWIENESKITVRRQPFTWYHWFAQMHFQHGYKTQYLHADVWAVLVDVVTVSMWLWVLTGTYMWWKTARGTRRKLAGAVCAAVGLALFGVLAVIFFQ